LYFLGHGEATPSGYENVQAVVAEVTEPDPGEDIVTISHRLYFDTYHH
jgi:hypothetical protein